MHIKWDKVKDIMETKILLFHVPEKLSPQFARKEIDLL